MELERTEFVRVGTQHALLRRIVQAAEIDTVIDSRLVVDSVQASPRDAHEINVIGTMNILAACGGTADNLARAQGDLQVLRALLRLRARRPGVLHGGDAAPAPAAHAPGVRHRRGRERGPRLRGAQQGRHGDGPALRQRPRPGAAHLAPRPALAARDPVHPRLRPALPVRPRGRHRRRARARRRPRAARHLQRGRRRRAGAVGGGQPARAPAGARPAALGDRTGDEGAARHRRADPGGGGPAAALRARAGQPQAQGRRIHPALHDPRGGREVRRGPARAGAAAGRGAPYRYEREVEEFLRYSPSVRRRGEAAREESAG